MPVRVGRRIRQLILQSRRAQQQVPPTTQPLCLRCTTSSKAANLPPEPLDLGFRRKSEEEQLPRPPLSPEDQTIRQRIISLFSAPNNVETERKLVELRNTPLASPKLVCLLAEALVHHAYILDALETINQSRKNGMHIPPRLYESIVFRFAQRDRWAEILNLLEPLQSLSPSGSRETDHTITTRLCEWRVRACAELGDFAGMERALGMFPHGIPLRAWKVAERACLKNSDPRMAARIQEVLRLDKKHKVKGKKAVGAGERDELRLGEVAQILIGHFQAQDVALHDALTSTQIVRTQTNGRDHPTYLITKRSSSNTPHSPDLCHSFTPDSWLATRCVLQLVQSNRVTEAAAVVAAMCKKMSSVNGASPSQPCSSTSTHETAPLSLSEIFASVYPDIHVFNALIKGVLNIRGLSGMLALLEIMHDIQVKPDALTATLLLRYLDRQRAWSPGRLIDTLVDLTSPISYDYDNDPAVPPKPQPVPVSIQHTNVLLSSILNTERNATLGGGWKASAAFLKYHNRPIDRRPPSGSRLTSSPSDVDPPTAGLKFQARAESLKPILDALRARGVRNDSMAYALRAQRDGVVRLDPEAGRKVLQRADIPLGDYHYAALMAGLVECGYMDSAKAVMKSAHESGFGAGSPVMHTILITGYGRMGLPRQAERVFKQMLLAKVKADAIAVDALAGAWFIAGEYQRARQTVLRYWPGDGELPFREDTPLKKMITELRKLRPVSKVRRKHTQVSAGEDAYVGPIVQAIKAPDKTLPLTSNIAAGERKDGNGSNSRRYSSVAGVGLQLDAVDWMKSRTPVGTAPDLAECNEQGKQKPRARIRMMLSSSQNG
ncbi:pentatricopeptide repeat-containing protein 5, mitochondrial [Rhizoctonia solani]|uniref:Pentatricopeptide repeat-containing protein 5, mitochondrial n=1 Tax=Rhizoctonia solani TaxID=456999 RepID=A0A8H8T0L1_9AGAM|nr:pentatricopeptide repeat-containing protein 5, mitochondrial [Rhizoctonia solani]QRW24489.1 pentatricopeptide repeat-containing protein 5, mitochondrial [Rhizoctonia solani]